MGQGVSASPRPHSSPSLAGWWWHHGRHRRLARGWCGPASRWGPEAPETFLVRPGFFFLLPAPFSNPFSVATFGNYGAMLTRFEHFVF